MTISKDATWVITITLVAAFVLGRASSQTNPGADNSELWSEGLVEEPGDHCGEGEFECKNGACIGMDLACDGRIDCSDQSDETLPLCSSPDRSCREGEFRCDYGACAPEYSNCDGVKNCFDNSDELLDECPRPLRHTSLLIKLFARRGNPYLSTLQSEIKPPVSLQAPQIQSGLRMQEPPTNTTPRPATTTSTATPVTHCLTPELRKKSTWKLVEDGGKSWEIPQGVQLPVNSKLRYSCDPGYETDQNTISTCLENGEWSPPAPTCTRITVPNDYADPSDVYIVKPPPRLL